MLHYEPEVPAAVNDIPEFVQYIVNELRRLGAVLVAAQADPLEELHAAPIKPRLGMVVLADGTDWNPGSGQGVYAYYNSAWNKLG